MVDEILKCGMSINASLRKAVSNINLDGNWYHDYMEWLNKQQHQFNALIIVKDPFDFQLAGDALKFDKNDSKNCVLFDNITMAAFFAERIYCQAKKTVESICVQQNPQKKVAKIKCFFEFVQECKKNQDLAPVVCILHDYAQQGASLHAKESIDFITSYKILMEIYQYTSVQSIYLLFTLWRIIKDESYLYKLIDSIIGYIKLYFYEYGKDPNMHLDYPIQNEALVHKLSIIIHWLELIVFHTMEIFSIYKEKHWLLPVDCLVDNLQIVNQISKYEMLSYSIVFQEDDEKTRHNKAIANHSYCIWIKTTDVVTIYCDVLQMIYNEASTYTCKLQTTQAILLEMYDNMLKIQDKYMNIVFTHRAYYQSKRSIFNFQSLAANEKKSIIISNSIEDVLQITSSIIGNNIEDLMKAKQKYKSHIAIYMTEDQQKKLDEYMMTVAEKIKESVSKLNVYDELYESISDEFQHYSSHLLKFPKIFASLVSAEYLYNQYIKQQKPNDHFDYSCISIMYYMALQDFVNKLIYTPYARDILNKTPSVVIRNDYQKYISSPTAYWDKKVHAYKSTCEIGNLGYLLANLSLECKLADFLLGKNPYLDLQALAQYGEKLKGIAPRRNEAAHGGNLRTFEDVKIDKEKVYISSREYKGLILELLEIMSSNSSNKIS